MGQYEPMLEMVPSAVRRGRHVRTPRLVLSLLHVSRLGPHLSLTMQKKPPTSGHDLDLLERTDLESGV